METQNYQNHRRWVPMYHFVLLGLVILINLLSLINLFISKEISSILLPILLVLISVSILIGYFCMRTFPLKAQDRAIRAEENLRHFALTGKLLDKNLTMSQIIALRFASDADLAEVANKALKENLSNIDIKKALKSWRADDHRA